MNEKYEIFDDDDVKFESLESRIMQKFAQYAISLLLNFIQLNVATWKFFKLLRSPETEIIIFMIQTQVVRQFTVDDFFVFQYSQLAQLKNTLSSRLIRS